MMKATKGVFLLFILALFSCKDDDAQPPIPDAFTLVNIQLDEQALNYNYRNVSPSPTIKISFSSPIQQETAQTGIILGSATENIPIDFSFTNNDSTVVVKPSNPLKYLSSYNLSIGNELKSVGNTAFDGPVKVNIVTTYDPSDKFSPLADDELLTQVQRQTFKYFFDFAHPASGMARERNTSGDIVTTGGSGFGIMALIVGIERGFITRQQGVEHLVKIIDFLEKADRFRGVWPHWLNGNTGKVVPFSANDNGGDLVETSFLIQGLLTFRQYLDENNPNELPIINRINLLWESVEWDWYTKGGEEVLYWHWSPDKEWAMNHQVKGYNEALITYFLAAASPTHSIDADVYHKGWANNGGMKNGKSFFDILLPLGYDYGGPLFFAHYSFLGLDPRNLSDRYGNYWDQNVSHSLINHAYSKANPKKWAGFSDESWGLTASDNHLGYSAHSPTNDLGVITPTAALSSFPYTPEISMKALKFFYYKLGDKLWGDYGFYDAFNLSVPWFANSYLAIDQGPIIILIENHRTGLIWDLFMSAPEVQTGMTKLEFSH